MPHPTFVREGALFFDKHWADLSALLEASKGSLSKPHFAGGPRAVRITSHADLPKLRLQTFSRFKFCALADVSRFFPSVYTHTIPWAINGKAAAKKDRQYNSAAVYGNRLDFIARQSQDGQTIGIPVGPDTSRVTSEIILAAVDKAFERRSKGRKLVYLRHVDDYWIAGNSFEECERQLQNLRLALHEYELALNEFKTKIVSTNVVFGESWPTEFEREIKEALSPSAKEANTVAILSKIVDRATGANDDGMIRHAIRKVDDNKLWAANWSVLEHFLAQCAIQFSHSFDYVARVVAWRERTGQQVDKKLWKEVALSLAGQAASLGRDSEVLWSLWLLKELDAKISRALSSLLVQNSCALVLGYLAHFFSRGLTVDTGLGKKLWDVVDGDIYAGRHWPLTLELTHLDIASPAPLHSKSIEALQILHKGKASLIDWDARPRVFVDEPDKPNLDGPPEHAIEDYTSDYDSDGDENDGEEDEGDEGGGNEPPAPPLVVKLPWK